MTLSNRNRKRILIFLIVPVLITIFFFTEDLVLKIITAVILLIYVGFIIFLRDSIKMEGSFPYADSSNNDESISEEEDIAYETDEGEGFKIISGSKDLDVITSDTFNPSVKYRPKNIFKPPDLKENFDKIATEELPSDVNHDEQFAFVLAKILTVIKEAYLAHSSVYFWYNKSKERLTLEKYVSSSNDITERKFKIEDDILSKIVQKEEPELLTDISPNAEKDVIRYYNSPQGIRSFVGVPLFYGKKLAGVLALDSKEGDAFGIESIYSLGRIVRVISILISLFEDKYADSQSERRLKGLLDVLSIDKKFDSETELHNTIENSVKNLINWDAFTFVYFNPTTQKFVTSKIINKTSLKYIGENLEIDLNETIVGQSILSGSPVLIDDTSSTEFNRFSKSEDVSFDGAFMVIPLIYDEQNYGVLCFESLKKNIYTNEDVRFLKNATKFFAFIVYAYSNQYVLKNLLSVDIETTALNLRTFIERLSADLVKAKEFNIPSSLCLIQIDDFLEQESLFEGDPFPKVLSSVTQSIRDEMTPLNILGRLSHKVFGVYFFNSTTKDVFLWAEKLRIKIARKPISVVTKQTTFTISIGVASANNKTDVDEVIHNAELALNKALEKGGNTVKSIN